MTMKFASKLTNQLKNKIIQQALDRRLQSTNLPALDSVNITAATSSTHADVPEQYYRFSHHPGYQRIHIIHDVAEKMGVSSPYFKLHEGIAGATSTVGGKTYINFSSYNYVGLSGDSDVANAAKEAIDRYGTSVSASRIVSGERPIHRELEDAIARAYGVDAALVFVSGHATNVTTIGYLFGPRDLIVHDALVHDSALQGIMLSGAKRMSFAHNDWHALDQLLTAQRAHFERVLIIIEGIYSMDGDYPNLPEFIALKEKHRAFLMVDEAHSFGVLGKTGMGIREHFDVPASAVDIWMGTLSKSLAGCGGFIAGENALIENLKFLAPGFLYSVGMSPPLAAASLAALKKLIAEPERVATLAERGQQFLREAKARNIDVGSSSGYAVVPAMLGSSLKAGKVSAALFARGINAMPIVYPAVPESAARIRFFISSLHTPEQITETVNILSEEIAST
jgi:8-amino-7-oxononanoate synthase